MSDTILVAIEAERIKLQRRLAQLDALEQQARAYAGDEPAKREASPKLTSGKHRETRNAKPATGTGKRPRKGETDMLVLQAIRDHAPVASKDLQRLTGRSQGPVDSALRRLFGNGKVRHDDGFPRRWALMPTVSRNGNGVAPEASAVPPPAPAPEPPQPAAPEPPPEVPQPDEPVDTAYLDRRLMAELRRAPGWPASIALDIDADPELVASACERLAAAGEASKLMDGRFTA